jgi:Lon protease-like protein
MDPHGDRDLRQFANVSRLFPLPRVVLFPHAVLPLHIFEPRYRQMTEDALAGDRLITIVQWRAPFPTEPEVDPELETVGCLGRILEHERLPDGRFSFVLLGRKRVRLGPDVPSNKLYRLAVTEILEDANADPPHEELVEKITHLFRAIVQNQGALPRELDRLLESAVPLGVLTDLVAAALGLPPEVKQELLAETRVDRRGEQVAQLLGQAVARLSSRGDDSRPFPPPFSAN